MGNYKVFDAMSFELDDAFHKLTPEEMKDQFPDEGPGSVAFFTEDGQMRILMYHKKVNPLMLAIADKKTMRASVNQNFRNANPTYECLENYAYMVDGKKHYGLRYKMETSLGPRLGDSILLTRKGNYIMVSVSYTSEQEEWAIQVISDLLATIKF